jgi:hypothetical protein
MDPTPTPLHNPHHHHHLPKQSELFRKTMARREQKQSELLGSLQVIHEQIENYINGNKLVDQRRLSSIQQREQVYQELLDEASGPLSDEVCLFLVVFWFWLSFILYRLLLCCW